MLTVDVATIRHKFKIASSVAIVLKMLLEKDVVRPWEIEQVLAHSRKAMWRIRKDLSGVEGLDLEIKSQRLHGYWIDESDKPRIIAMLGEEGPAPDASSPA